MLDLDPFFVTTLALEEFSDRSINGTGEKKKLSTSILLPPPPTSAVDPATGFATSAAGDNGYAAGSIVSLANDSIVSFIARLASRSLKLGDIVKGRENVMHKL